MSGKRPTDHLEPSAKKRGNERQLTKDDGSEDDEGQAVDPGNFARASEEVLKQRKIIKARRGGAGDAPKAANPFAGIQLAPGAAAPAANPFAGVSIMGGAGGPAATPAPTPTKPAPAAGQGEPPSGTAQPAPEHQQPGEQQEAGVAAEAGDQGKQEAPAADKAAEEKPASLPAAATGGGFGAVGASGGLAFGGGGVFGKSSFGSASGGFGSLAGGSSGGAFSFGAASTATASSSIFSFSTSATPTFSFAAAPSSGAAAASGDAAPAAASSAAGTGTSLFGAAPASGTPLFGAASAAPAKVELPEGAHVPTGEEDERTVFSGEGALFEFDAAKQWRERGRGEMRVNVASNGQARLVMRQKGNLRLLMNANLWPEMQVSKMEGGKGATFACVNVVAAGEEAENKGGDVEAAEAAGAPPAAAAVAGSTKLATFALRIKLTDVLDQFIAAVNANKCGGKKAGDVA